MQLNASHTQARGPRAVAGGGGHSSSGALVGVSQPSRPVGGSPTAAALGSVKSIAVHPFPRPTRRSSGLPSAAAELARWASRKKRLGMPIVVRSTCVVYGVAVDWHNANGC